MQTTPTYPPRKTNIRETARTLLRRYGPGLVGRTVDTPAMGEWAGGICTVTEIRPDKNAPEIVFNVKRIGGDEEEIGVFEFELVKEVR